MKKVLVINGSASQGSSNQRLINRFVELTSEYFVCDLIENLKVFPHFDPELSVENAPDAIIDLRKRVEYADAVLICTPEYVFSIPSGLKNILEWCVSTTVFSGKSLGIITASASGEKGHEELKLIMSTLTARFTPETTLLIQGIKGKINEEGMITDAQTNEEFQSFIENFRNLSKTL